MSCFTQTWILFQRPWSQTLLKNYSLVDKAVYGETLPTKMMHEILRF